MRRSPLVLAAAAAAGFALLAAGCGGGGGSPDVASVASSTTTAAPTAQSGAVAFAECMRSHGIPGWPDPIAGGVFDKAKLRALGVSPNRIRAIQDGPCRNLLPANGDTPETIQQQRTRVADGLSFARCMRGHGLARFPDPTPQGQLTIEMVRAQGIDVRSPRILRIVTKCLPASHGALTPAKVRQALNEAGG